MMEKDMSTAKSKAQGTTGRGRGRGRGSGSAKSTLDDAIKAVDEKAAALEDSTLSATMSAATVSSSESAEAVTATDNPSGADNLKSKPKGKWTVSDILRELNIENTDVKAYANDDIQLSAVINARKIKAAAKAKGQAVIPRSIEEVQGEQVQQTAEGSMADEKVQQDIGQDNTKSLTVEAGDILPSDESKASEHTIKQYLELKNKRQQKVIDFELTGSLSKTAPIDTKSVGTSSDGISKERDGSDEGRGGENAFSVRDLFKGSAASFQGEGATQNIQKEGADSVLSILNMRAVKERLKLTVLGIIFFITILLGFASITFEGVSVLFLNISTNTFLVINSILLLLGLVSSYELIQDSFNSITKRMVTAPLYLSCMVAVNILLNVTLFFCEDPEIIKSALLMTPLSLMLLTIAAYGGLVDVRRALRNYHLIATWETPHTISDVEDDFIRKNLHTSLHLSDRHFLKNAPCKILNKFLDNSFNKNFVNGLVSQSAFYLAGASVFVGVVVGIVARDFFAGFASLVGFGFIMYPTATFLVDVLPLDGVSRRLNYDNGVIEGVLNSPILEDSRTLTINAHTLFPKGTTVLREIKTFKGHPIDEAIVETASILCETKSVLSHLFLDIINNNKELLKPVDTIVHEDSMGISAWVNDRKVLIGNRKLMDSHNVVIPFEDFEQKYIDKGYHVIFVASSGVITATFIFELTPDADVSHILSELYRSDCKVIIKTIDYMITPTLLSKLFSIPAEFFTILPTRLHSAFDNEYEQKQYANGLLCNDGTLKAYANTMLRVRQLREALRIEKVTHFINMGLSLLIFILLAALSRLTAVNILFVLLYNAFWFGVSFVNSRRL